MFPTTAQRWADYALLLVGGLLGWLLHPVLWLAAGPFRWLALLTMTAAQESGYNRDAAGDGGDSVGMLQFNVKSWPTLTGRPLEDRASPFWSGFYAARYVQLGLLTSWGWWKLALPIEGPAVMRWMWTHGISASAADDDASTMWSTFRGEGHSYSTWLVVRGLTLLPAVVGVYVLVRLARRLAGRR